MKKLVISSALLVMLGLSAGNVFAANGTATQISSGDQLQVQTMDFVDENEDGVCDNYAANASPEAHGECDGEQVQEQAQNRERNCVQAQEKTMTQTQLKTQTQEKDGECQEGCTTENAFANQNQMAHNYSNQ